MQLERSISRTLMIKMVRQHRGTETGSESFGSVSDFAILIETQSRRGSHLQVTPSPTIGLVIVSVPWDREFA